MARPTSRDTLRRKFAWTLRWIGAPIGAACLSLFVLTLWFGVGAVSANGSGVYTVVGYFHIGRTWFGTKLDPREHLIADVCGATFTWHWVADIGPANFLDRLKDVCLWPSIEYDAAKSPPGILLRLPLGPIGMLLSGVSAVAWHRHLRRRPGGCIRCGYSLAGLPARAPCPECGHPASPPVP